MCGLCGRINTGAIRADCAPNPKLAEFMKKLALVLAVFALTACSKPEPPTPAAKAVAAPTQPVKVFPSVYADALLKPLALAYEQSLTAMAALSAGKERTPTLPAPSAEDLSAMKAMGQARQALSNALPDPEMRVAAFSEVNRKAFSTPEDRRAYHLTMRRVQQARMQSRAVQASPAPINAASAAR